MFKGIVRKDTAILPRKGRCFYSDKAFIILFSKTINTLGFVCTIYKNSKILVQRLRKANDAFSNSALVSL